MNIEPDDSYWDDTEPTDDGDGPDVPPVDGWMCDRQAERDAEFYYGRGR